MLFFLLVSLSAACEFKNLQLDPQCSVPAPCATLLAQPSLIQPASLQACAINTPKRCLHEIDVVCDDTLALDSTNVCTEGKVDVFLFTMSPFRIKDFGGLRRSRPSGGMSLYFGDASQHPTSCMVNCTSLHASLGCEHLARRFDKWFDCGRFDENLGTVEATAFEEYLTSQVRVALAPYGPSCPSNLLSVRVNRLTFPVYVPGAAPNAAVAKLAPLLGLGVLLNLRPL
eukprot:Gregarina_sp_Pseudo_9__5634@NODE_784_length_2224_cov_61_090618_g738_i0_p2_GENE_NODE_784_length_2224_cov_61_090618_g738_i0NODE_784_length_2224_cov_61_090618_g738_i0_p2_ORF_typecomplete_len228_score58_74_NODE_784_length_2224_cov_61_090618_g738_i015092192